MKNLFFILLIILVTSCTNDPEIISEKSEVQLQNKFSTGIAMQLTEDALTLISAFTGRTLLKYRDARLEIQNRLNLNSSTIDVRNLLETDNAFRNAFKYEFDLIVDYDDDDNGSQGSITHGLGSFHPPIDIGDEGSFRQRIAIDVVYNLLKGKDFNCFELYFPKPFVLGNLTNEEIVTNEDLYSSKHPLNNVFPYGYKLWQNSVSDFNDNYEGGVDIRFDDILFQNQDTNIIIARPYRSQGCTYSLFSVNFEDFYN